MDLACLVAESEANPKHVAGLLICQRPPKTRANFVKKIYDAFLGATTVEAPFNRVVHFSATAMPSWQDAESINMADHIFYHKMEPSKNWRQDLYQMVSGLHVPMLDRSRPLWEVHVIDGLPDGKFALYQKIHHAYADGVALVRWITQCLDTEPGDAPLRPVWSLKRSREAHDDRRKLKMEVLQQAVGGIKGMAQRFLGIGRLATMLLLEGVNLTKNAIALPYVANGHTPLNGQVTPGRQFASVCVPMATIGKIRQATRSSVNHVALTCIDDALQRYLKEQGIVLDKPITIQMPVDLRQKGEVVVGNKFGVVLVELSPPTDDPYVRLRNIGFSLRNVRTMVDSVVPEAIETYTLVTGMLGQLGETLQISARIPPLGNMMVSNVQGPAKHLYIMGAKMEELHPLSTLLPSNLLNLTLFSYAGELYFGLIAADDLPDLHRLGDYLLEAFAALETAVCGA
jgi:WS/DGAT/MGAT family acyltransferase